MLNGSTEPSIYKLSSRAPRFFCPDTGMFSYDPIVRIRTVYAVNILLASSRMLIAALRSIFSMQISPLSNILCFRPFRLTLLYHGIRYRTSVLFYFCAIHLPPAEEGEFLLYYLKKLPTASLACSQFVYFR